MRVVLDTNVVVSGVFFGGRPREVLEAWRQGVVDLVFSLAILDEYERVGECLAQRHPGVDLNRFLQLLEVRGQLVGAVTLPEAVTTDPDDDKFFACALAGDVKVIVSGDTDLLEASGWRGIEVLTPADFLEGLRDAIGT